MTQEEIVYQYYLKQTTKNRDEAIELLKKRDFKTLQRNYNHWFDKKEKIIILKSSSIGDVINELSKVKYQDNETEPTLSICISEEKDSVFRGDTESHIEICSYIYTIVPYDKCESLAKHSTKSSIWKMNYQPNGKDAKACRKIIKNG